jgi:hypothetical protein
MQTVLNISLLTFNEHYVALNVIDRLISCLALELTEICKSVMSSAIE